MATKVKKTDKNIGLKAAPPKLITKKQKVLLSAYDDVKKMMTPEFIKKHNIKPFERL